MHTHIIEIVKVQSISTGGIGVIVHLGNTLTNTGAALELWSGKIVLHHNYDSLYEAKMKFETMAEMMRYHPEAYILLENKEYSFTEEDFKSGCHYGQLLCDAMPLSAMNEFNKILSRQPESGPSTDHAKISSCNHPSYASW